MGKPNILFIMADQLRYDAIGLNGAWVRTPNIDQIAKRGINFTNCFTNSPVSVPARASIATGFYPHNMNLWKNLHYTLPENASTWMQVIRNEGYRTSLFGKTHLHPHIGDIRDREYLIHAYGFDDVEEIVGPRACRYVVCNMTERWKKKGLLKKYQEDYKERFENKPYIARPSVLPIQEYADVYIAQKAKEYLSEYNRKEPWFCWLSFGGPHEPWDAPEPYASMYDLALIPSPLRFVGKEHQRAKGHLDKLMNSPKYSPQFEPDEINKLRANYAGRVTLIDEQIGEILKVIEKRRELDNTAIVFTSDHGEMNGDFGLIYKESFLNSASKVPLIIQTPDLLKSKIEIRSYNEPVELFDIGPTIVDIANAQIDYRQFGKTLAPIFSDTNLVHRKDALSEVWGEIMLVNQEWKIAINEEGKPYLLFNLKEDPKETKNLAGNKEIRDIENSLRMRILERITCSLFM